MAFTIATGNAPVAAANIEEAIDNAVAYVWFAHLDTGINVRTLMDSWNDQLFQGTGLAAPFDKGTLAGRQILNWSIPMYRRAAVTISTTAQDFLNTQNVDVYGNLLWRVLGAVRRAELDGEITTAQRDDVVTLFNTVWT